MRVVRFDKAPLAVGYMWSVVVAGVTAMDDSARSGPEFSDPSGGGYELDRIDLRGEALSSIDLKPAALKKFILANREALLAEGCH